MNLSRCMLETKMDKPHKIVIVGGGTAGWMAANLMMNQWKDKPVTIHLIESPDIPIIGVGEGSTPNLRRFFKQLNIKEDEWMKACNATYKVNIRFSGWSPSSGIESYSHPFTSQLDIFTEKLFVTNCRTRRLGLDVTTSPSSFFINGWLADQRKSPLPSENFPFQIEYGYHFDSALLGKFLKEHAINNGVQHISDTVTKVNQNENGDIASVLTKDKSLVSGDFFIDCTGFQSLLLQKTLGVDFSSFKDNLFNDRAVVLATEAQKELPVETAAVAMSSGWMWNIPLQNRTGNGYVYSSSFIDDDKAASELCQKLNVAEDKAELRFLKMNVGQVEQHWHKNCLALGLSQGFIEPLEATALHLIQVTTENFIQLYQKGDFTNKYIKHFNQDVSNRFERVRDYIVAHYKLNGRSDSDYWIENRENMKLSKPLLKLLDTWYKGDDLVSEINQQGLHTHFGIASWHCILSGYGVFPGIAKNQPASGDLFKEHELAKFFNACMLNFKHSDY